MTANLALILGIIVLIGLGVWWLYRRGRTDQALKDTQERLRVTQEARDKEREIRDAAEKVRREGGPTIPDL